MAEIDQVERYFLEKASEANFGLWNALLTINGIMVSAFSFIISLAPRFNIIIVKTLIIFCATSIILILWNYLTTKWHYSTIGQRNISEIVLSEEQRQADIERCLRSGKLIRFREYIAILLLLLEVALVVIIVFTIEKAT